MKALSARQEAITYIGIECVLIEEVLLDTDELVCNFATAKNASLTKNTAREIVRYKFSIIKPIDQYVGKLNVPIRN